MVDDHQPRGEPLQLFAAAADERHTGELSVERVHERHGISSRLRWYDAPRFRHLCASAIERAKVPNKTMRTPPPKPSPSSSVLLRYSVDREVLAAAEKVCDGLDLDLIEVLRECVRRIAVDGAVPFELRGAVRIAGDLVPLTRNNAFLEADLAPLKAELLLGLLGTFIAERTARLEAARAASGPDAKRIARWERELTEAIAHHRTLDVNDGPRVERLDARFRALLAEDGP